LTGAALTEHIAAAWPRWFPGRSAGGLRFGFLARSTTNLRRGVIFVFGPGDRSPRAVVKVSLDPRGDEGLRSEHAATTAIHQALGARASLAIRLPRPLALEQIGDTTVAAFTAVPGALLLPPDLDAARPLLGRRTLVRHLAAARAVGGALAALEQPPGSPATVSLPDTVDDFIRLAQPAAALTDRLASFRAALERAGPPERAHWQHGDLAHGNLLFDGDVVGAVDLELASADRPAWFDEAYAVLSLAFMRQPAVRPDRFVHRFDRARWPGSTIGAAVGRDWRHATPAGWALALTAMSCAVRDHALHRGEGDSWTGLVAVLLGDPAARDRCSHLVAQW
jgi:hypothetical protein